MSINVVIKGFQEGNRLAYADGQFMSVKRKGARPEGAECGLLQLEQKIVALCKAIPKNEKRELRLAIRKRSDSLERRIKSIFRFFRSRKTNEKMEKALQTLNSIHGKLVETSVDRKRPVKETSVERTDRIALESRSVVRKLEGTNKKSSRRDRIHGLRRVIE